MAGYTRNDTGNNIANGNVIDADDLDGEFNAIETAFGAVTGHTHGGTAGDGAPITRVGPAQDLVVSGTQVLPKTTNTLDLGSSSFKFKDAYVDGVLYADEINYNGTVLTVTGTQLNALSGLTASVTELNYTDGVTSAIQTQLDGKQPLDAELTALAGLTSAADRLPYFTGLGTAALATFSSFGRTLIDDADAAAARTTLALGTMATQAASAVAITGGTITGITDLAVADGGTGVGTITGIIRGNGTSPFTAAVAGTDFLAPAAIGTTIQAFDADLSAVAGLASNGLITRTGAGTAAARTITAGSRISVTNGDGVSGNPTIAVGTLDITTADIQAATLVTEAEGIAANDLDTRIPTAAAVKDYVDTAVGAGGLVQPEDTRQITLVSGAAAQVQTFTGLGDYGAVEFEVYTTNTNGAEQTVDFSFSTDGGSTWSAAQPIGRSSAVTGHGVAKGAFDFATGQIVSMSQYFRVATATVPSLIRTSVTMSGASLAIDAVRFVGSSAQTLSLVIIKPVGAAV